MKDRTEMSPGMREHIAQMHELSGQTKSGASAHIARLFPTLDDEKKLAAIRARMEDCNGALLPSTGAGND